MNVAHSVAFPFIGGVHHVSHTMPVACALARRADVAVTAFAADEETKATAAKVAADLGVSLAIEQLRRPVLTDTLLGQHRAKLPLLWRNRRRFAQFDAVLLPERTSLVLRRMGVTRPLFMNLPHGAGDRAVSVEPRYREFDRILVAGPKTAERMVANGIDPARIRLVGYPKAEYLANLHRPAIDGFDAHRPTIMYNPHFRRHLSSLDQAHDIVRAVASLDAFNLIVAPHIRSFEGASVPELQAWKDLAVPGRVVVDTGSPRMIDMSYVAAADLYIGDVSSQVYEYLLLKLRPCLFINAHGVAWLDDPSYRHWLFGDVVTPDRVMEGISAAFDRHKDYAAAQREGVAQTFTRLDGSAESAADAVMEALADRR